MANVMHEIDVGTTHPLYVEEREGLLVVRDDLHPGGTKARVIHQLFDDNHEEYVYASPVQGYAQVALAFACREYGKRAVVFCAGRRDWHRLTMLAHDAGATIEEVGSPAYLTVVQKRAADYAERTGAKLLPFGLKCAPIMAALSAVARRVSDVLGEPKEVWSVASSGTLTLSLQDAWPGASFHAVRVGAVRDVGRAVIHQAPERFEQDAKRPPLFPSCLNYDAKAWRFVRGLAREGALLWNVAA